MENVAGLIARFVASQADRAQKHEAFSELVRQFQDMAFSVAYGRLKDFHFAQDVAQEAFLVAYQKLDQLREPSAFPVWLSRIVHTQCHRNMVREKRLQTESLEAASDVPSIDADAPTVVENRETRVAIHRAIEALPENQRVVTTLYYLTGYSQQEIADLLAVSLTTVKKRLQRARERLKERMLTMMRDTLEEQRPSRNNRFVNQVMTILNTTPVYGVADIGKTVQWYRDVLGFDALSDELHEGDKLAIVRRDGISIAFRKVDGFTKKEGDNWDAYIRLTGVDRLYDQIRDKASVLRGPEDTSHNDRELEVRDINGYVFAFGEWTQKRAAEVSMYGIHPVMPVLDIPATIRWYKEMLGFEGEPWQKEPPYQFAMLRRDKVELFFLKVDDFEKKQAKPFGWDVYIQLARTDVQKLYAALKDRIRIIRPLEAETATTTEFEIEDCNGHLLCLGASKEMEG